jgi:TolB-like protein/Flp pilus assembly protein TadD
MSLFAELRRRNVFRVAVAYLVSAWLIIQVVETIFPAFGVSDAAVRIVVIALAIGLVLAVVGAWAFELTPEGLKLDKDVDPGQAASLRTGKQLDRIIMVMLALGLAYFAFDKFVLDPVRDRAREQEVAEQARSDALLGSYGEKSIAVMPFADMSAAGDQAYFSDGIAEELLNLLAKLHDLRVISRSSSFALRDDGLSTPELAKKLNVAYVLEGSVRKDGDQVRITAQLIEASTDTHLWSQTFDRTLDNIFAVQDQISAQVVRELKIRLLHPAPATGVTNKAAYELYLQGLSLLARRGSGDLLQAERLFEQVVAIDPNYAPGYAGLATALVWGDSLVSNISRVETAVSRTLALDAGNPDALAALGLLRDEQGRKSEARDAFEQAIAANPNHALALRWLGRSHSVDDPARYYALARKAYFADPLDPTIQFQMSVSAIALGRFDEALKSAKVQWQTAGGSLGYAVAGSTHISAGDLDLAMQTFFRIYLESPDDPSGLAAIPRILMDLNELELADAWRQFITNPDADIRYLNYSGGNLAIRRGQSEQALQLFAQNESEIGLPWGSIDLGFAHVHMKGDFNVARRAFERGLTAPGSKAPRFDPDLWNWFLDYALALQRSGSPQRAAELIAVILALLNEQATNGVVMGPFENLQLSIARLHAMSGDTNSAMVALRLAATQGGLTCVFCLRNNPHFDHLRDVTGFAELVAQAESNITQQRQRLADAGLLLTPAELSQLEQFSFDPFAN